jgi:hypothetical protein
VPETLERRVLDTFSNSSALFRKTSCAVSYAHGLPDYNGHYGGVRELCDICPLSQLELCANAHRVPTAQQVLDLARVLPEASQIQVVDITERAAIVSGLAVEQPRYFLGTEPPQPKGAVVFEAFLDKVTAGQLVPQKPVDAPFVDTIVDLCLAVLSS